MSLVERAQKATTQEECRQSVVLGLIAAVTVGEVFLNLWLRVRIESLSDEKRRRFLKELNSRISLDAKLKRWPTRYLSSPLDLSSGPGAEFVALKNLRNSIVHFTSSYDSIALENVSIHGLADITDYDALAADKAIWAASTTEGLVAEIFRLAGVVDAQIPHALHLWIGKFPAQSPPQTRDNPTPL
jgi:hypothetical protein